MSKQAKESTCVRSFVVTKIDTVRREGKVTISNTHFNFENIADFTVTELCEINHLIAHTIRRMQLENNWFEHELAKMDKIADTQT